MDKGHGRLERRVVRVSREVWRIDAEMRGEWEGLSYVAEVVREREELVTGRESRERVLYIGSGEPRVEEIYGYIRGHWEIENGLHYILDMSLGMTVRGSERRMRRRT